MSDTDLTAVTGSFEWAMLQLKAGHRASRQGWNGKNMYLLRNPGLTEQIVVEGDYRALAGVEVGTCFNYLPNIEIRDVNGNFVPWIPSQADIEANDWMLANEYYMVIDVELSRYDSTGIHSAYGFAPYMGKCEVVDNNTSALSPFYFVGEEYIIELETLKNRLLFWFNCEDMVKTKKLVNVFQEYSLKVTVDNKIYDFGHRGSVGYLAGNNTGGTLTYTGDWVLDFMKELKKTGQKRRFYLTWSKS
jgi:hypothetical protein